MKGWIGCLFSVTLWGWASQQSSPPTTLAPGFVKAWTYLTTETLRYRGAVPDGQNVYVPLAAGQLLALKLASGELVWAVRYEGELAADVQIGDGALYVATTSAHSREKAQSFLLALDKNTGQMLWQRTIDERITSLSYQPYSQPPDRGRLYVGTATGVVIGISPSTSKSVWSAHLRSPVRSQAKLHEGILYIGSDDGYLHALEAATPMGGQRWQFKTGGPVRAPVHVSSSAVFVGSFDGWVYCLDRRTGKLRWKRRTGAAIEAQPTLASEAVVVGSYDNFVYALDQSSGAWRWKVRLSGRIIADPIVLGEAVLVSALRDYRVLMLRISTGQPMSSLDLDQGFEIVAAPKLAGDVLILTTDQGIIAARLIRLTSR